MSACPHRIAALCPQVRFFRRLVQTNDGFRRSRMAKRYIYFFGNGKADGTGTMKDLLGGKGAGLAEMTNAGVPVPPGFTITTEVCNLFYDLGKRVPEGLDGEMHDYMK